ncbi:hypothetical protein [Amycolatopsis sp. NBC_01480]|uniref:hypothetical protein n=1 Tax=Amycolatopsis sp. NBC_01480 TaxID=2903562 RepID=UPI002E2DD7C5|nr:hypothetical protein [Amycolatopsis sp. NBC_01480]
MKLQTAGRMEPQVPACSVTLAWSVPALDGGDDDGRHLVDVGVEVLEPAGDPRPGTVGVHAAQVVFGQRRALRDVDGPAVGVGAHVHRT